MRSKQPTASDALPSGAKQGQGKAPTSTRTLWKGAISFGLVHIPVGLYSATVSSGIDFDWLDRRSMEPVGYKRVNKITGKEIATADIVKGVEYELLLPLTLGAAKEHPAVKGKEVVGFNGTVMIDRLAYKVGDGKLYKLGVVGKDVEIVVTIEALADK